MTHTITKYGHRSSLLALIVVAVCSFACGGGDSKGNPNDPNDPNDPSDCPSGPDCQPAEDCTQTPCTGFTYCNLATKECEPGCATSDQCGANEECDIVTHDCYCTEQFHECSDVCVSNASPQTCGDSCTPCPSPANGRGTCSSGQCGLACDVGYHLCGDVCAANDDPQTCGSSCTPCPGDPNGAATCAQGQCGLACNPRYAASADGACAPCPTDGVVDTACSGGQCVASACQAGLFPVQHGVLHLHVRGDLQPVHSLSPRGYRPGWQ